MRTTRHHCDVSVATTTTKKYTKCGEVKSQEKCRPYGFLSFISQELYIWGTLRFFFDKVSYRLLSGMTTAGDWYSFAICFQW